MFLTRASSVRAKGSFHMKKIWIAAGLAGMAFVGPAGAATVPLHFNGPGVSGSLVLTVGTTTDAKYPDAFEITAVSGTFSDTNNGLDIINAAVGPLQPINFATPEPTNLRAPHDFSNSQSPPACRPRAAALSRMTIFIGPAERRQLHPTSMGLAASSISTGSCSASAAA